MESRMRYGILGWGGVYQTHLKKVEILQKRIIKLILGKSRLFPTEELYEEFKVMDPRQLYMHSIILHIYNHKHILRSITHRYETRAKENMDHQTENSKKRIGQRSFYYLAARTFNSLPIMYKEYIFRINSISLVKKIFKKYVLDVGRNNVDDLLNIKN